MRQKTSHPRYTSFEFRVLPTAHQQHLLQSYAGAARFAKNQCRALLIDSFERRNVGEDVRVPRSAEDFINAFNSWKESPAAGVDGLGRPGLSWRHEVLAQVFEEAATDFSRALKAFHESRAGTRKGRKVGFPKRKKKATTPLKFRIRNKLAKNKATERVSQSMRFLPAKPRVLVVPGLGDVLLRQDTRSVRRLLRAGRDGIERGRIMFGTFKQVDGKWYVRLQLGAPLPHEALRAPKEVNPRWAGVDVGLTTHVTVANENGEHVMSMPPPRPLKRALKTLRKVNRALARKRKVAAKLRGVGVSEPIETATMTDDAEDRTPCRSRGYKKAKQRCANVHVCVARQRDMNSHVLSGTLVKNHDLIAGETLGILGLLKNEKLAMHIADAAWGKLFRQLEYKSEWYARTFKRVGRWFPSSKLCSGCGWKHDELRLKDRVFHCQKCGLEIDRDLNLCNEATLLDALPGVDAGVGYDTECLFRRRAGKRAALEHEPQHILQLEPHALP
jgi:putative transposase